LKDDAHPAVTQPPFQLIAAVENRFTEDGLGRRVTVIRAVVDVIGETATTSWTFFHLLARSKGSPPSHLLWRQHAGRGATFVHLMVNTLRTAI
jgi:hypothetical protein